MPYTPFASYAVVLIVFFNLNFTVGATAQEARHSDEQLEWFEREVRPILAEHCSGCHNDGNGTRKGGLSLHSYAAMLEGGDSGPAIVPRKPDESLLVEAIRRESFEMPPEAPLPERQRKILEKWVAVGAPWPREDVKVADGENWRQQRFESHWAWKAVRDVEVPVVENDAWSRNAIDKFILAKLREEGMEPAEPCSTTSLRRRLSFDLVGLPPESASLEEIDEASFDDEVAELLASPQYGVRWGRHWLDLVRYAETLGHEFDYPVQHAWRYREAVIDSFNADVPYNRFVYEHLAGDQIDAPRIHPDTGINQSQVLTGFWFLGDSVHAPVDAKGDWATRVDNQIDVLSKTFMGMTIACARCHDHKFDAIGSDDYYGLAGIAESTRRVYAITDPYNKIATASEEISELLRSRETLAAEAYERCGAEGVWNPWLVELVAKLQQLESKELDKKLPLDSPAKVLSALVGPEPKDAEADPTAFLKRIANLKKQIDKSHTAYAQWFDESVLYADLRNGIAPGWRVEGRVDNELSYDWFFQFHSTSYIKKVFQFFTWTQPACGPPISQL